MAISEDASTPAATTVIGSSSATTLTTAAFSPPANSWLVAMIMLDYNSSGTPIFAMSSTISGNPSWTSFTLEGASGGYWVQMFILPVTADQSGITVTVTNSGTAPGMSNTVTWMMDVRVVDGAASDQTGAAFAGLNGSSSTTTFTSSITPTTLESWIYCTVNTDSSESGFTNNGNTTTINSQTDSGVGTTQITGHQNPAATTSLSSITLGWTNSGGSSTSYGWAALEILPVASPSITTTSLPTAYVGEAYSYTLTATGGTTPYTWSISSGSLPGWASLNSSTGVISGTPGTGDITYSGTTFTVEVTDNASLTATQSLTLLVFPELPLESAWPGYPAPGLFVPGQLLEYSHGTQHTATLVAAIIAAASISRRTGKVVTAPAALTATVRRFLTRSLTALTVATAIVVRTVSRGLSAPLALLSTLTTLRKRYVTAIASTVIAVNLPRKIGRILAGQAAVSGVLGRSISKIIAAVTNAAASIVRLISRALVTVTVAAAAATKHVQRTLAAIAALTGKITRSLGKQLAAAAAVTTAVVQEISRTVAGSVTATGTVIRTVNRNLVGLTTVTASTAISKLKMLTLTAFTAATGTVGRVISKPFNGTASVTSQVARGVSRLLPASLALTVNVSRGIGKALTGSVSLSAATIRSITRGLITGIVSFISVAASKISGTGERGPLHIVLPGSGVTAGAFNIVIPLVSSSLSGAFTLMQHLPGPIVSLAGTVWYGLINVVLPVFGITITGTDYYSAVQPVLPTPETSITGVVDHQGMIFVDLSHRSAGTHLFEELLTPAKWKLGALKRQWKTHLTYTQDTTGQLGIEWGSQPPEVEDI